ncbi:hypothetical protein EXIGLDRAFT_760589 [Exidia glandulosa HHB12029]|uniref:Uncharacterized protein n=1 Tax=Exidia glandulosa HHB12029 TaxID=1314781 RepID=A0A165P5H2_EXIGL|nr:hypothetical protein EXIGLDRAFT_760589 [Exidia glandulosa HHB12029]
MRIGRVDAVSTTSLLRPWMGIILRMRLMTSLLRCAHMRGYRWLKAEGVGAQDAHYDQPSENEYHYLPSEDAPYDQPFEDFISDAGWQDTAHNNSYGDATQEMSQDLPRADGRDYQEHEMSQDAPGLDGQDYDEHLSNGASGSVPSHRPENGPWPSGNVPTQGPSPQRYTARTRRYPPMVIGFTNGHNRGPKDRKTRKLHRSVRKMMKEKLGFGSKRKPSQPHPPAAIDDIARFLEGGPGADMDNLQLDLITTSDGIRSHWNADAAKKFAAEFLQRVDNCWFGENVFHEHHLTSQHIRELFLTRIRYFRELYRSKYFPASDQVHQLRKALDRRTSRRLSLHKLRKRMCRDYEPGLQRVLEHVDDEMISEDETDIEHTRAAGIKVFRRVRKTWVNPELTSIFHNLLDVHLYRMNVFAQFGAGNQFRQRINHPSASKSHTGVVVGLPVNFYNSGWLRRRSPEEISELRCEPLIDLTPFTARLPR